MSSHGHISSASSQQLAEFFARRSYFAFLGPNDSYSRQVARSIIAEIESHTDVEVVRVEGTAMSEIGPEKALAAATTRSKEVLAHIA